MIEDKKQLPFLCYSYCLWLWYESKEKEREQKNPKQKHKFLTRLRPFHSIFVQIVLVLIDKSSFSAMVFGYVLLMEQTTSQNTNEHSTSLHLYIFPCNNGKLFNK